MPELLAYRLPSYETVKLALGCSSLMAENKEDLFAVRSVGGLL